MVAAKENVEMGSLGQTVVEDRLTIRPGLIASIFNVGLCLAFAVVMVLASTTRGNSVGVVIFELSLAAAAVLLGVYLLGLRVEADDQQVAKLYLFGLVSRRIPYAELDITRHSERNANLAGRYDVRDFNGRQTSFSLTPTWVWRRRDIQAIVERCRRAGRRTRG